EQDHRTGFADTWPTEQDQPPVRQSAVNLLVQLGYSSGIEEHSRRIRVRLARIGLGQGGRPGTTRRSGAYLRQRGRHFGRSPSPPNSQRPRCADLALLRLFTPGIEHAFRELVGRHHGLGWIRHSSQYSGGPVATLPPPRDQQYEQRDRKRRWGE